MKTLEEAIKIIRGGKRFEFEYGDNGLTVLVITGYYTGERLRLDLANIDEEILDALQVERYRDDLEED